MTIKKLIRLDMKAVRKVTGLPLPLARTVAKALHGKGLRDTYSIKIIHVIESAGATLVSSVPGSVCPEHPNDTPRVNTYIFKGRLFYVPTSCCGYHMPVAL